MIYMLELHGKGIDKPDSIIFRIFKDLEERNAYVTEFSREHEKYYIRFIDVRNNEEIYVNGQKSRNGTNQQAVGILNVETCSN